MKKYLLMLVFAVSTAAQNVAVVPNKIPTDNDLGTASHRASTTLGAALAQAATSITVASTASFTVPSGGAALIVVDNEVIKVCSKTSTTFTVCTSGRGFDGTSDVSHANGAAVYGYLTAHHINQLQAEVKAIAAVVADSRFYNFTAQTPGGTLTAAVGATVTLSPCPVGVAGTNTNHYLYVSGGTGTAEAVLITGGTCTSGAATGTITFTPANNHSGAWTIASATAGIQEAKQTLGAAGGIIQLPAATLTTNATIYLDTPVWLRGQSIDATKIAINNTSSHVIRIHDDHVKVTDLYVDKAGGVGARTGNGIEIDSGYVEGLVQDVRSYNHSIGINSASAYWLNRVWCVSNVTGIKVNSNEVRINHTGANSNTNYGIWVAGGTGIYFYDAGGANNGISNIYASGVIADWSIVGGGSSVTTSGPGVDLSGVTSLNAIMIDNFLSEGAGANQPSIKVGPVEHFNLHGSTITAGGTSSGVVFVGATTYDVIIHGNWILGAIAGPTAVGIDFSGSASNIWLSITGNIIKRWTNLLKVANLGSGIVFTGNYLEVAGTAPGTPISGALANSALEHIVQPNYWTETTIPTYASSASVAIKPFETIVIITGTTPIATLTEAWVTREVTLIFTNAAPGGLTTGGNIARAQSAVQNQAITIRSNGTNWY